MFDVAIAGLGPAGWSLASACAARGLSVLAAAPRPDAPWTPTYGVWADEVGDLPASVVHARVENPELRAHGSHPLRRPYVVLDNQALRDALPLNGVDVRPARLDDAGLAALHREARTVIDARGARPDGYPADDPAPAQTAWGLVLDADAAAPALAGAEALLMDFRTDWAEDAQHPRGPATFLYAIPVGDGGILLEETCLAAAPGLPTAELKERLARRLTRRGVAPTALAAPRARELVRIPMRGRGSPPAPGVLALGTAGRGGHLVTGYSVAHSLRTAAPLADAVARAVATGRPPRPVDPPGPADLFREAGLRALLRLDVAGTLHLFDAFGRLSRASQAAFLSRDAAALDLARAMWGMFTRMPPAGRRELIHATLGR